MKTLLKTISNWRNKRRELKKKSVLTSIYLESVGKTYFMSYLPLSLYDEQGMIDLRRNKEKHTPLWNKSVKKKRKK